MHPPAEAAVGHIQGYHCPKPASSAAFLSMSYLSHASTADFKLHRYKGSSFPATGCTTLSHTTLALTMYIGHTMSLLTLPLRADRTGQDSTGQTMVPCTLHPMRMHVVPSGPDQCDQMMVCPSTAITVTTLTCQLLAAHHQGIHLTVP
jgi:hypothetical protein